MRKTFLLLLLSFMLFSFESIGQKKTAKDLYGKWVVVGRDSSENISLEIFENGKVSYNYNAKKLQGNHKINFNKKPIWFDITDIKNEIKAKVIGIIRFLDDDTIEWEPFLNDKRSTTFNEEQGYSLIFKRIQ